MSSRDQARNERLAAALRENLRKRKAQARQLNEPVVPANPGSSTPEGADEK